MSQQQSPTNQQQSSAVVKKRKQSTEISAKTLNAPCQLKPSVDYKDKQVSTNQTVVDYEPYEDLWPREGVKLDEHLLIKKRKQIETKLAQFTS